MYRKSVLVFFVCILAIYLHVFGETSESDDQYFIKIEPTAFPWSEALCVDFGDRGLHYYNGWTWTALVRFNVEAIGSYQGKLVADGGAFGLYEYDYTALTWKPIKDLNADNNGNTMLAYWNGLVVDFGDQGLQYFDGATWTLLAVTDVQAMAVYRDKLVVDAGAQYGLYEYDGREWKQISSWDPDNNGIGMLAYQDGLVTDFNANGLHYYNGQTWRELVHFDVEAIGGYQDKLVADGGPLGLYEYDIQTWKLIKDLNADNTGNTMLAYRNGLVVDFGNQGLQYYDGATWTLLAVTDVQAMAVYGDKLVVDAGTQYGLYEYNGREWKQIQDWDPDNNGIAMIGLSPVQ